LAGIIDDDLVEAANEARADALLDDTSTYVAFGVAGACLAGVIGCIGASLLAYNSVPNAPGDRLARHSAAFQSTYLDEYRSEVRFRRARSAFFGGAVVMIVTVVLVAGLAVFVVSQQPNGL
jgi:hypothetical protein